MKNFCLFLLSQLILFSISQLPVWNFEKSASDLLSEGEDSYAYEIYNSNNVVLKKEIKRENSKIVQNNYLSINSNTMSTNWENIYSQFDIGGTKYICPSGKNYLSYYANNELKELKPSKEKITKSWDLICYYQKDKNIIYISYLNSEDNNLYAYYVTTKKWYKMKMHDGYLDAIWPKSISSDVYHMFVLLMEANNIMVGKMEVAARNENDEPKANIINSQKFVNTRLNETFAFFDKEGYFYWITHNDSYYLSGYSENPLDDFTKNPSDIKVKKHENSPFEFIENITIKYMTFIRNTKYAFYEIISNNKTFHGVIDIKLNKIILNTDEMILDFKPYSDDSLLFTTEKSAYKICVFAQNGDKCENQCPEGQQLILDPSNKNHCGEKCDNYILKPMDVCIDECDSSLYITQNPNVCGLCKYLNHSYPFKIINESFCREEKLENTYFYDKQLNILNYCHSSCKTCSGEKENQCLSCESRKTLKNGKCIIDICDEGYYKTSEENCEKCDSNCKSCSGPKENNDSHCLSCNQDGNKTYLITAKGLPSDCVETCPEHTKPVEENKTCIFDNEPAGGGDKQEQDSSSSKAKDYILWIFIILGIIIVLLIVFIVVKNCFNKGKKNSQLIETINDIGINSQTQ